VTSSSLFICEDDVNVPSKSNKQNILENKIIFVGLLKGTDEKTGSGARAGCVCQRYGSSDPDPYQNVTDPNTASM
jgi:hypothetical protein